VSGGSERPKTVRKVQVGPYKMAPPKPTRQDAGRSALAGRAKRHLRGVSVGPRKVTDPDEEVKILPKSKAPARRLGSVYGDVDLLDDDE